MDYIFLGFNNEDNKYLGYQTQLILQCNKCKRIWKTTTYDNFMHKTLTCDGCHKVWKMEKDIELFLQENKISFMPQHKFPWLKNINQLSLDFYLPDYNIAIECQGKEHFQETPRFGGIKSFSKNT